MKENITQIWREYDRGKKYIDSINLRTKTERNNNFYLGKQWENANTGNIKMPVKNIIKPIVDYKVGVVAQNNVSIVFSADNITEEDLRPVNTNPTIDGTTDISRKDIADRTFQKLNKYIASVWEKNDMDSEQWKIIREAVISGDCYLYFLNKEDKEEFEYVDNTNIFFADENNEDIQSQDYILIVFRRPVSQIRQEARENGLKEKEIENIVSDNNTDDLLGNKQEVETDEGKCTCILKLLKKTITITDKETGVESKKTSVFMVKSTKGVEYCPETDTEMTMYPVVGYGHIEQKNNARCMGEPEPLINNQIEINATAGRRLLATMMSSYPKLAYIRSKINNPDALTKVGVAIELGGDSDNTIDDVSRVIDYLRPTQISPDAKQINDELKTDTMELAGANETALGNINPENASGKSIIAVRDNTTLPLSYNVARFRKFIQEMALVLFDMWQHCYPNGKTISYEDTDDTGKTITIVETIPSELMNTLKAQAKVEVTNTNPYSIYARQETLDGLLKGGYITFDEWVELISDNNNSVPKISLEELLKERKKKEQEINTISNDINQKKMLMESIGNTMQPPVMEGVNQNEMQVV